MFVALIIFLIIVILFLLTFCIYYFNLDMKLVRKIYEMLGKYYDNIEKDRKL